MLIDGGYGSSGNLCMNILLESMDNDTRKSFENELKKNNPTKFNEFKDYLNLLKEYKNKNK